MPNITGSPLASTYRLEASKANGGDAQAAADLFKGLYYCSEETFASLNNKDQLNNTIANMQVTYEDRWGGTTDNLSAAVAKVRQQYHYCAGISMTERSEIGHWASLASKTQNPDILAHAWPYIAMQDFGLHTASELLDKRQQMIDLAANAGVPVAWQYKSEMYTTNGLPAKAYASLYTEYLLTQSPYLAYKLWELSQQLTPLQVQDAEARATENYQKIRLAN